MMKSRGRACKKWYTKLKFLVMMTGKMADV